MELCIWLLNDPKRISTDQNNYLTNHKIASLVEISKLFCDWWNYLYLEKVENSVALAFWHMRKLEVFGFNISNLEGRAGGELLIFILESRVCNHQVIDMHTV